MSNATHSRRVSYGVNAGTPDMATATCGQHAVASPYTKEAGTYVQEMPTGLSTVECVICPLPEADLIGTVVLSYGNDGEALYGGRAERPCMSSLTFDLRGGGMVVLHCDPDKVMPVDTPIPANDTRVSVIKLPKKRNSWDGGVWLPVYPGSKDPQAVKTKTEALKVARRRTAVATYSASRQG